MAQGKKEEAEAKKAEVAANSKRLAELEVKEAELKEKVTTKTSNKIDELYNLYKSKFNIK